jgi:hypothetical protein
VVSPRGLARRAVTGRHDSPILAEPSCDVVDARVRRRNVDDEVVDVVVVGTRGLDVIDLELVKPDRPIE